MSKHDGDMKKSMWLTEEVLISTSISLRQSRYKPPPFEWPSPIQSTPNKCSKLCKQRIFLISKTFFLASIRKTVSGAAEWMVACKARTGCGAPSPRQSHDKSFRAPEGTAQQPSPI